MLEALDQVDWSKLSHAYGSAEDVPGMIRAIADTDPEVVQEGYGELFGSIWHQGTVYSATAYAVPFLIELLESPGTKKRTELIILLHSIASGHGYLEVHGELSIFQKERGAPDYDKKLAVEKAYVLATRKAVADRDEVFWKMMDEEDAKVRLYLPFLLSVLPNAFTRLQEQAFERIQKETDPAVSASILFALARACRGQSEWSTKIETQSLPSHPLVSLAVAHVVLMAGDPGRCPAAAEVALRPLIAEKEYEALYRTIDFPWGMADATAHLLEMVGELPDSARPVMMAAISAILPQCEKYTASCLAHAALTFAFKPDSLPKTFAELNSSQLSVLEGLARDQQVAYLDSFLDQILSSLKITAANSKPGIKELDAFLKRNKK